MRMSLVSCGSRLALGCMYNGLSSHAAQAWVVGYLIFVSGLGIWDASVDLLVFSESMFMLVRCTVRNC